MRHLMLVLGLGAAISAASPAMGPASAQMDILGGKKPAPAAQAIDKAAPPARIATQDAAAAVRRANAYFNGITTLIGDFTQSGNDGRKTSGTLYLQKPGKLRFEYTKPSPLEVIADGTSVAIRNRKLATQDLYFIGQTPLKFLLKPNIDLARDTKILDVTQGPEVTSIKIEDKATFGGTSRITLVFNSSDFSLRNWVVSDPQGFETLVALSNVDLRKIPDPALFRINYERTDNN
ncbi:MULTISPECIES: outer-membrane lipoprotein carrier protein LolA [unclassified Beijerinckia]|uniref:outer-membrane lipoprotein carrier protein LolA n=1 Tax=unclassified Beijerinckia TaxID=2638183 RepID=UPI00089CEFC1|nr:MULTISPECIES: outer-membrane lipoprotein carrier protein LolA [unclassified Beijerinckia]MDH7798014.1 outer membrane lipoprotein-sorting protein [Beijerinckia sp. GAS462]SED05982.1 Outer membrane lipoprotein-sorting protein [Beijerinckia sp. 28-YEA-48]